LLHEEKQSQIAQKKFGIETFLLILIETLVNNFGYKMSAKSFRESPALAIHFRNKCLVKLPLDKKNISIGNTPESDIFIPNIDSPFFDIIAKADGNRADISIRHAQSINECRKIAAAEKQLSIGETISAGNLLIKIEKKKLFPGALRPAAVSKSNTLRILPEKGRLQSVKAKLKWKSGNKTRSRPITTEGLRVGKSSANDVVLKNDFVSAHHCIFALGGGGVKVFDLQSTNGTWIDSNRIYEGFINNNESVKVGDELLDVEISIEKKPQKTSVPIPGFIANSQSIKGTVSLVRKLAPYDETVLLLGETGVGKEILARALHHLSPNRAGGSFIAVNCAAIPTELAESELFGHVKGAFTGADKAAPGAFMAADGGTLLLDEIAELPLKLQPKLLRVLETKRVTPIGAHVEAPVNVRVVASTHRNLSLMVAEGKFRQDLYYRLMVLPIDIPPLNKRKEDIIPLAKHFITDVSKKRKLTKAAREKLLSYDYPGNVRELKHIIVRAALMSEGNLVNESDINFGRPDISNFAQKRAGGDERERLLRLLQSTNGNREEICREMGVSRATLFRRLQKYGLSLVYPWDKKNNESSGQ